MQGEPSEAHRQLRESQGKPATSASLEGACFAKLRFETGKGDASGMEGVWGSDFMAERGQAIVGCSLHRRPISLQRCGDQDMY